VEWKDFYCCPLLFDCTGIGRWQWGEYENLDRLVKGTEHKAIVEKESTKPKKGVNSTGGTCC
jgi:hypothetical protein